jgi:hypothetical protein
LVTGNRRSKKQLLLNKEWHQIPDVSDVKRAIVGGEQDTEHNFCCGSRKSITFFSVFSQAITSPEKT